MELEYLIADPTGNITALVLTPVPKAEQPRAAAALMEREKIVEQTGFLCLDGPGPSLRMAGGEFCGNAAMSAAAAWAREQGARAGQRLDVRVRVSGVETPVDVTVGIPDSGGFSGSVDMPRPLSLGTESFELEGAEYRLPLVAFPGITHIIAPADMGRETAQRAVRRWCRELGAGALGLMLLDERRRRLTPLVYVPGADTMFWESSCASGTAAVGAWLAARDGRALALTLREPGGELSVEATPGGAVLRLGGHVRLSERKKSEIAES